MTAGRLPLGPEPEQPARRLSDRLLADGALVAREYTSQDRLDPDRPILSQLVAEAIALAERRGEERVLARIRALIGQREQLRDERLDLALQYARAGNLPPAASELRWASDLDQQLGSLRLLLAGPAGEGQ